MENHHHTIIEEYSRATWQGIKARHSSVFHNRIQQKHSRTSYHFIAKCHQNAFQIFVAIDLNKKMLQNLLLYQEFNRYKNSTQVQTDHRNGKLLVMCTYVIMKLGLSANRHIVTKYLITNQSCTAWPRKLNDILFMNKVINKSQ